MNVPEKHRAIAHAWVDGAEVEYRHAVSGGWIPVAGFTATWGSNVKYRIKPKPLKLEVGKIYRSRRGIYKPILHEFIANGGPLFVGISRDIYNATGKCVWSPADEGCHEDDDLISEVEG